MSVTVASQPGPFALDPRATALVVVDMQNDFGAPGGMFDRAGIPLDGIRATLAPIVRLLPAARAAGVTVVFLKMGFSPDLSDTGGPQSPTWLKHVPLHAGDPAAAPDGTPSRILVRDTWNTSLLPELVPAAADLQVWKTRYSGFVDTGLDAALRARGVRHLVLAGCTTSICVEATLRDATHLDYPCLLLEDCCAEPIGADLARSNHDATLLAVRLLYGWTAPSAALLAALAPAPVPA